MIGQGRVASVPGRSCLYGQQRPGSGLSTDVNMIKSDGPIDALPRLDISGHGMTEAEYSALMDMLRSSQRTLAKIRYYVARMTVTAESNARYIDLTNMLGDCWSVWDDCLASHVRNTVEFLNASQAARKTGNW